MKAEKFHNLPSESGDPEAGGTVQMPESQRDDGGDLSLDLQSWEPGVSKAGED